MTAKASKNGKAGKASKPATKASEAKANEAKARNGKAKASEAKAKASEGKASNGKASKPATKGVGVIGSILEFLRGASKEEPLSKADLVAKLAKRFPEREAEKMAKTVGVQLPSRIAKEQEVKVEGSAKEGGFWIA